MDFDIPYGGAVGGTAVEEVLPATYTDTSTFTLPLTTDLEPFGIVALDSPLRRTADHDTFNDDRSIPYIQSFNFSISRELARNTTLKVTYIANKSTGLWQSIELNEPNIWASWQGSETFLEAFNLTRAGGDAPLFNDMLMGISLGRGTCGTVNGTTCTGSAALRAFSGTDDFFSDGEVGELAEYLNGRAPSGGRTGDFIRRNGFPENLFYVNPQFDDAQLWGNNSNSTYHSMQVQFTRRLSAGFSSQFTYTWSKGLGEALGGTRDTGTTTVDFRDRSLNYGRLNFDRRHGLNAHGTWQLPFGPGQSLLSDSPSWVQRVVEGWTLSGIMTYSAGSPLIVDTTTNTIGANNNRGLPNIVGELDKSFGEVTVGDGFVEYFPGLTGARASTAGLFGTDPNSLSSSFDNRDIFRGGELVLTNPAPGTAGTLGMTYLEGPGRFGLDFALAKSIQLTEGVTFQLRADAINLLNQPQWDNPQDNINSRSFGRITGADGEREFTINARIDF